MHHHMCLSPVLRIHGKANELSLVHMETGRAAENWGDGGTDTMERGAIHDSSSQKPLLVNAAELWQDRLCDGRVSWFQPQQKGTPHA